MMKLLAKLLGWKARPVNTSGLHPVGHALLLRPYEPEFKASALVIPETVLRRTAMVEMRTTVIAVGPQAWRQEAKLFGLWPCPRARVGDRVIVSMYCGAIVQGPADGQQYRYVNDEDVYGVIVDEDLKLVRNAGPVRKEAAAALRGQQSDQQQMKEIANG